MFIADLLVAYLKYSVKHGKAQRLVIGNTKGLEKNHFHDVICNQQF